MRGSLRAKQFELAMLGNPTMLIWLGKQELGQTDRQQLSGYFEHEHVDLSRLSDEQRHEIERIMASTDLANSSNLSLSDAPNAKHYTISYNR